MLQRAREETPRWLALVAIGAVAIGSYAIAPAVGGPAKLTTKRAKALFYTKTLSNSRYYTKSASDARYLPKQSGETHVTLDPWDWDGTGSGATKSTPAPPNGGFVSFTDNDAGNQLNLHDGSVLTQVVSKGLRLNGFEICYELDDATISQVELYRSGPIGNDPVPTQILVVSDSNPRTLDECRRISFSSTPIGVAAVLDLRLTVDFNGGGGEIRIGRSEAIFVP